jgi:SprB repeat/Secretion system C-terminal sorting domain
MRTSTLTKTLLLLLAFGLVRFSAQAQVLFSEDFDGIGGSTAGGPGTYTFPAGWLLRNVDNRPPNTNVAYMGGEAFIRREDFANNVADSAAFSTSWTTPVGLVNRWMWTPAISGITATSVLSWNAVAYDASFPDGYEVRIMTAPNTPGGSNGTIGNQITNSTVVFTVAAENTTWTPRSVSLAAFAGQTIYVAFRNNSNDMFLLLIDDVTVENPVVNNAVMSTSDTLEYTLTPSRQTPTSSFNGRITNNGSNAISGVFMRVRVLDNVGAVVYTNTSPLQASLAPQAVGNFAVPAAPILAPGDYTIEYTANHSVADLNPSNDTLRTLVTITTTEYARDNGVITGGLGIGAGNGGFIGQDFELVRPDIIDTIGIFNNGGPNITGRPLAITIWSKSAGLPNVVVASTDTIIFPDDSARYYRIPMATGAVGLPAGDYTITGVEFPNDSTIQVGTTLSIFTPGSHWVNWPTSPAGGWANLEAFGGNFSRALVIRPDLRFGSYNVALTTAPAGCGQSNGSATATVTGGPTAGLSYNWSNGATTATASGLAAGNYGVTVTAYGIQLFTGTATVANSSGPSVTNVNVGTIPCNGGTATISLTLSGGTAPLTYLWSNGGTTPSITVAAGTYSATITDGAGCVVTVPPTVLSEPTALSATINTTDESAPGANDGSAVANATGGTAPYTYLWSNGSTSNPATGLTAGAYTVTITDANGCTTTQSTSVLIGINDELKGISIDVAPNPSNGQFNVNVILPFAADIEVVVFDPAGKRVYSNTVAQQSELVQPVSITGASGIYLVKVQAGDVQRSFKVAVNR